MNRILFASILIFFDVIMTRPIMIDINNVEGIRLNDDIGSLNPSDIGLSNNDLDGLEEEQLGVFKTLGVDVESLLREKVLLTGRTVDIGHQRDMSGYKLPNNSVTPEYMLELYDRLSKSPPILHNSNIIRSFKNIPTEHNKLHLIKPTLGEWHLGNRPLRREEVVLARCRIGHTRITHSYLLKREEQPQCIPCYEPFTVKHFLLDCVDLALTRQRYFQVDTLKQLFDEIPVNMIMSFLKETERSHNTSVHDRTHSKDRVHSLVFDISALDHKESINLAELRLYTLIKRDQNSYIGIQRLVTIYEIIEIPSNDSSKVMKYNLITSNYIDSAESAWERFGVTSAVKRSIQKRSKLEHLEVRIRSISFHKGNAHLDINADPSDMKQPILVVYSNDKNPEHEHRKDRHEFLMHELATSVDTSMSAFTHVGDELDDEAEMYNYNAQGVDHERFKRSKGRICRRRPMLVNFDDISFDRWVIAPRSYQAYQCAGKCYYPLSDHVTPTIHSYIQAHMNMIYPRRVEKVCCVPTKLDPISILYIDSQNVVTFKYSYDGMVVAECGCR